MALKQYMMTADGLRDIEAELEFLKTEKRREVAEEIKQAKSFGDLSENSEYDEAKNKQAQVETRIAEIETILKNVKLVDAKNIDASSINIGCHVVVLDIEFDETFDYHLVGSTEANITEGKISDESPLGVALMGHKEGETVTVDTPNGKINYKIISIGT